MDESKISEEKISKLLIQLRSDKNLASKLGLLDNEPSVCSKRKSDLSPLRTKKFVKTAEGNVVPAVAGPMGAGRTGQGGALAPPWNFKIIIIIVYKCNIYYL